MDGAIRFNDLAPEGKLLEGLVPIPPSPALLLEDPFVRSRDCIDRVFHCSRFLPVGVRHRSTTCKEVPDAFA
jgi:hypothetical protein